MKFRKKVSLFKTPEMSRRQVYRKESHLDSCHKEKRPCPLPPQVDEEAQNQSNSQSVTQNVVVESCAQPSACATSAVCPCPGQSFRFNPQHKTKQLISAQELKARLDANEAGLVVIDVTNTPLPPKTDPPTPHDPAKVYKDGHINGALFIDWRKDLADQGEERYYDLPPREQFQETLRALGIKKSDKLVFYDNFRNRLAIRALFVLEYFGHRNVQVLEGGVYSWTAAGYPLVAGPLPVVVPSTYTISTERTAFVVDIDYVRHKRTDPCTVVLDARPYSHFTGEAAGGLIQSGEPVARRGHIMGAVTGPWPDYLVGPGNTAAGDQFKTPAELAKYFIDNRIIVDNKQIIAACNEGIHAVFAWFVLVKMLNHQNVVVYEGSTGEWADYPLLPMVSGLEDN
jgi:thiosulfate/3-mercaptopyruvate sulfurtransferase